MLLETLAIGRLGCLRPTLPVEMALGPTLKLHENITFLLLGLQDATIYFLFLLSSLQQSMTHNFYFPNDAVI